jgi:ATP-dependent helicase HrpA
MTALPPHLRPRFEVVGTHERKLGAGRDLNTLREQLQQRAATSDAQAWKQVVARWERYGLTGWDLGDLPERIPAGESSGLPLYAYPGLQVENGEVNFRLFRKPEEATAASREGVPRLAERVLAREFAWLQQDLRTIQPFQLLYASIGPADELMDTAWENLRRHLLGGPLPALTAQGFADYVESARRRMKGLVPQFADWVGAILRQRQEALACRHPLPSMKQEVDALLPRPFLRHIPFEQLRHVPRYLQALLIRAQRALLQPAKDAEKARRVQPYVQAAQSLRVKPPGPAELQATLRRFIWLVEELKVSVFAQELGTAEPVSSKRLDALLAELRAAGGNRETGT